MPAAATCAGGSEVGDADLLVAVLSLHQPLPLVHVSQLTPSVRLLHSFRGTGHNPPTPHLAFAAGGWYIEWAGYSSSHHPAWLDPAVCVLAAAFDTLDHERARQQPQGLFGRVRGGDETAGGALSWVKAMLRFHGIKGR